MIYRVQSSNVQFDLLVAVEYTAQAYAKCSPPACYLPKPQLKIKKPIYFFPYRKKRPGSNLWLPAKENKLVVQGLMLGYLSSVNTWKPSDVHRSQVAC